MLITVLFLSDSFDFINLIIKILFLFPIKMSIELINKIFRWKCKKKQAVGYLKLVIILIYIKERYSR